MNKTKVLILFGGRSTEHEVSINSARNVAKAIDTKTYDPVLVGISKESGTWYYFPGNDIPNSITVISDISADSATIVNLYKVGSSTDLTNAEGTIDIPIQFVLPITHGKYGEDGCLQGLCRMFNLPFAGSAVASSAVCMDKDFTKRILESAGIPIGSYITLYANERISYEEITGKLGVPFFLKPANTGSSVGVYKVKSKAEFDTYMPIVFQYDDKIVIEKYIPGREIECAVLGNHTPIASVLGEIKPSHDFYSYEAKYLDPNGADLIIPAVLDENITQKVQQYALHAYKAMGCKGFARVDFFVTESNEIYLNEINTLPGFTNISMYPKLFEASGITYADLIDRIIKHGMEDYKAWGDLSTEHHLQ
ncbi:D-alanine--D-alanine ligase family protein [Candidatus Bodocaedibacter vickermanii]|uniref:D-alanine--D-alanine ligase n=1 Tax=Candidatus Bodocaedibacter vickermanii TaxID=2741701 RepID=A0A7L9RSC7_9PROT|nr:D-alanine--D-alanine ligase A [Candidatus Paracaedibacteraceae bacterium 'Lake Konstanz']